MCRAQALQRGSSQGAATGSQVYQLEMALKNLNNGAGLGFCVASEVVVDKKKLRNMYVAVAGILTTIVPILLAHYSSSGSILQFGSFANTDAVYAVHNATPCTQSIMQHLVE